MTAPRLLLCLCAVLLCASPLAARRLSVQLYTTADGLPRNSVYCLTPDPNGFLWLCTSEGLVRFDGSDFHTFGRDEGLPSSMVHSFLLSRNGGYWITTGAGVCRLPPRAKMGDPCRVLTADRLLGTYQSETIVETSAGGILVATSDALYRSSADGRRLELLLSLHSEPINTIAAAPDGGVLVGTGTSLYLWKDGSVRRVPGAPGPCGYNQVYTAGPGDLWVVGSCDTFRLTGWNTPGGPRLQPASPGHPIVAWHILRRRSGEWVTAGYDMQYWELTPEGTLRPRESLTAANGLPYPWVSQVAEDSQGDLWGATTGAGIFRLAQTEFHTYRGEDGLGSARIAAIFESLQGDLCVLTTALFRHDTSSQLRVRSGDSFRTVRFTPGPRFHAFGWGWNQVGFQAHDGEWWFPTDGGLYRFPDAKRAWDLTGVRPSKIYDSSTGLAEQDIFRIFEDSHHDIWISTDSPHNDLILWNRATGRFRHFGDADGWPSEAVATAIRETASGTIWFGTFRELVRFRNGRFQRIAIPSEAGNSEVRDLLIDRAGRMWVATSYEGLYRCDRPDDPTVVFSRYTVREGLSSDATRSLIEDNSGAIYLGTVRGVDRIDPAAPVAGGNILHYTVADGLPDSEQNVSFRDRRGHLWFGSLRGLAELDPTQPADHSAPEVHILRVRVRGEEVPMPWEGTRNFNIHLQSNQTQMEVEFAGIDLHAPASLRYQSRLADVDPEWSAPSTRPSVNYSSLSPGRHTFEVRALGADGSIGRGVATISLVLDAPLWLRAWFIALVGLLSAVLIYWLYEYRVRHLLALERLRMRIATDLHDDIGASLTQISLLSEVARRDPMHDVLGDIAAISRGLVEEMSDIVWAISPRHDRFDAIVHRMRHFAENAMPDGEVDFDTATLPDDLPLPLECRRPLYLIFKEAVNNVARHARATRIVIRLTAHEHAVDLTVEDNGVGFDPTAAHSGEGIASIRRRSRELSGAAVWDSRPGQGTHLTVTVPLRTGPSLPKLGGMFEKMRG